MIEPLNLDEVREHVNTHVAGFHARRIAKLEKFQFQELLKKRLSRLWREIPVWGCRIYGFDAVAMAFLCHRPAGPGRAKTP